VSADATLLALTGGRGWFQEWRLENKKGSSENASALFRIGSLQVNSHAVAGRLMCAMVLPDLVIARVTAPPE
jgi:hypothetical protein